jgi:hypothetical protein
VMLYLLNIELVRRPLTFMLWRGIRPRRLRERRGIGDTAGVALWRRCHVMHRKDYTRSAPPRHKCQGRICIRVGRRHAGQSADRTGSNIRPASEPGEVPHALAKLREQTKRTGPPSG